MLQTKDISFQCDSLYEIALFKEKISEFKAVPIETVYLYDKDIVDNLIDADSLGGASNTLTDLYLLKGIEVTEYMKENFTLAEDTVSVEGAIYTHYSLTKWGKPCKFSKEKETKHEEGKSISNGIGKCTYIGYNGRMWKHIERDRIQRWRNSIRKRN